MASQTTAPPESRASPEGTATDGAWTSPAVLAHVVPFAAWLLLMATLDAWGPPAAWKYAVRSIVVAALLVGLRPWRYYPGPAGRHLVPAAIVGLTVLALWVVPFAGAAESRSLPQELYLRFGVLPFGRLPSPATQSVYAPAVCGWPLALVRLLGSAFVIAVAEEFFWRGFVYRRLQARAFLRVPLGAFDRDAFWISAVLFGLEHRELLAGVAAGALYGLLLLRTRDIWAAVAAHAITNLALGLYVLHCDAYGFW